MMKFKNPETGAIEEVPALAPLWVLLFGVFYFAYKGIWNHVLGSILFAIVTAGLSWLVYPFFAYDILCKHYVDRGWIEVTEEA
ncbi:hypothetical protein G3480_07990 [Thiorhodococcus mannitoliphagus]|uniref:DUF4175 domain-containing protein n=1 Tax=Thiorhodococcus mannitoliphagus TaxID=329406 RepID=A0A6P1DX21_9GAMM|nr:hypothetical protein [Thiorhodococcus mannitoliphagus]NEX20254.1 hypothetical protein [Thiorhodococcus mannitoliphagus]